MLKKTLFFLVLSLFWALPAQGKLFQNTYVSFEIPDTWECKSFSAEWICHSQHQKGRVEAFITTAAKIAGPVDSLEDYENHLRQPKTWSNIRKERITSKKLAEAKQVFINKHPWVDSTHENSEVKSYISRYAGTVCCKDSSQKLGILVVLSAHQKHYSKYSQIFLKAINSLQVLDIDKAVAKIREAGGGEDGAMGAYLEGLLAGGESAPGVDPEGTSSPALPIAVGGAGAAGAGYLWWRRRKKRGKSSRRKKRRRI